MKRMLFLILGVYFVLMAVGIQANAGGSGELILSTCSKCHPVKVVCSKLGTKDVDAWKTTLNRMIKNGARLGADQVDGVSGYLVKAVPGEDLICQ